MIGRSALEEYTQFIQENTVNFPLNDIGGLNDIINFENYFAFLVGEGHAVSSNTDVMLAFIKFLNQNYGVRHIIVEIGYCDTILKNEFLETGDISILHEFMDSTRDTLAYTREMYYFYINLFEYNQTLPENERIILHGIDVQHNWRSGLGIIRGLLEQYGEMSTEVQSAYNTISKADLTHEDLRTLISSIDENNYAFQEHLGEDYIDFRLGLRSIWQAMVFQQTGDHAIRVPFIVENVQNIHAEFEIDKFFGMFGGFHTNLTGMAGESKNMAHFLNTEFEPTKNSVLSIMSIYVNSYHMDQFTGNSVLVDIGLTLGITMNAILDEAISGDFAVTPTGNISFGAGFLSDMYQYILVVRNSPASTRYSMS